MQSYCVPVYTTRPETMVFTWDSDGVFHEIQRAPRDAFSMAFGSDLPNQEEEDAGETASGFI